MTQKLSYSLAEAAETLSLGESNVRKFVDTGMLRSFKVGQRRLISREAIDEFLLSLEQRGYTEVPKGGMS